MKWSLIMVNVEKIDIDSNESISIAISKENKPKFLSDFHGGNGSHSCGYSVTSQNFTAEKHAEDTRRLLLNYEEGHQAILHPDFIRNSENFNLEECALKVGQVIKYSSNDAPSKSFKIMELELKNGLKS